MSRTAEEATSPVEIEVAAGRNQAGFSTQVGEYRVQIITRLLEGAYPNYEQVIPKDNPRALVGAAHGPDRGDRHRRLARGQRHEAGAVLGAREGSSASRRPRRSWARASRSSAAEYDGEELEIGYNASYLLEILRSIPTEQVVFRLKTALSAGVIEPVGALPQGDEELLCLIMPLRLPDASG